MCPSMNFWQRNFRISPPWFPRTSAPSPTCQFPFPRNSRMGLDRRAAAWSPTRRAWSSFQGPREPVRRVTEDVRQFHGVCPSGLPTPTSCRPGNQEQNRGLLQIEWVIFVILRAIPVFDGDAIARLVIAVSCSSATGLIAGDGKQCRRAEPLNPTQPNCRSISCPIVSPRARACKVWPFRPPPSAASDLTGAGSGGDQATMRCVADCRRTLASRHCSSASAQVFRFPAACS